MLLMQQLAQDIGVSYLYVTHDLAVARYMCEPDCRDVPGESGGRWPRPRNCCGNPLHPYTKALLSAVPVPDPTHRRAPPNILGDLTRAINPPSRCRFYDRCPIATKFCHDNIHPSTTETAPGHFVACYEAGGTNS